MFQLRDIRHQFGKQTVLELPVFEGAQGEHWLVLGHSESGKTTLLHIMAGILKPTEGTVIVANEDLRNFQRSALDQFRGQHIGIIFQDLHLLPTLTVRQNLLLAQYMAGIEPDRQRAREVLESLDLAGKARAYPDELSYGQRQRVGIGRAVMNNPRILLADEPTSALDDVRSEQVLDLLIHQAETHNATLVIATHDQRVKDRLPNRLTLDTPVSA